MHGQQADRIFRALGLRDVANLHLQRRRRAFVVGLRIDDLAVRLDEVVEVLEKLAQCAIARHLARLAAPVLHELR